MKSAVILANGSFPSHPYPMQILQDATFRVCCDGAAEPLVHFGLIPDLIIGDLDSLPQKICKDFSERVSHDPDQETNDLTKAVNACRKAGIQNITILGATGKREDHTLGNIGLLARYGQEAQVRMITDHGIFHAINSQGTLPTIPGQQISLFNMTRGIPVSASGLKYPVQNLCMDEIWQGTLNEAIGESITVSAPEATILVYLLFADAQPTPS